MDIRKIIREELKKSSIFAFMNENITNDNNYEIDHHETTNELDKLILIGHKLDSNISDNISGIQILSTGERSGRLLAEIGYPSGDVVLFYKSMKGTSGKSKGDWYPIPGFSKYKGWFVKDSRIKQMYGSQVFYGTADYLSANESTLDEIDLAVNSNPGAKPGIPREFPKEEEGGTGLGLRINTGPTEFPQEEDL